MAEPKRTYRIAPCFSYDITSMESWLEEMAAKGLMMEQDSCFAGIFTFVEGSPKSIRFRLEPNGAEDVYRTSNHGNSFEELLKMNREMGWQYWGSWSRFYIFTTDDPNAPELHTDPRVQALTIGALARFQGRYLVSQTLYFLLLFVLWGGAWFFQAAALMGLAPPLIIVGYILGHFVGMTVNYVRLVRLKNQLKQGFPMSHHCDYRPKAKWRYSILLARTIFLIYVFFALMNVWSMDVTHDQYVPLEDYQGTYPFATVEDLFPESEITDGVFIDNEVWQWDNWICPNNYVYQAYKDVRTPGDQRQSVYLEIQYTDARFDWFARCLATEHSNTDRSSLFFPAPEVQTLSGIDADYAVSYYEQATYGIVLRKGNIVLKILYNNALSTCFTPEELAAVMAESIG